MGTPATGTTLERLDTLEAALRDLTSKTEALEFRINGIVTDGTNRIGDIEFRLQELAGGDLGALPPTPPLGGQAPTVPVAPRAGGAGDGRAATGAERTGRLSTAPAPPMTGATIAVPPNSSPPSRRPTPAAP
jgi:TolA-binding protein